MNTAAYTEWSGPFSRRRGGIGLPVRADSVPPATARHDPAGTGTTPRGRGGSAVSVRAFRTERTEGKVLRMRLLMLGGTEFVGRAITEDALARGWDVTVFHRGRHDPPAGTRSLHGDRTPAGGSWRPRWKTVTSQPRARASSVMARPTNSVPPSIRSLMRRTLPSVRYVQNPCTLTAESPRRPAAGRVGRLWVARNWRVRVGRFCGGSGAAGLTGFDTGRYSYPSRVMWLGFT